MARGKSSDENEPLHTSGRTRKRLADRDDDDDTIDELEPATPSKRRRISQVQVPSLEENEVDQSAKEDEDATPKPKRRGRPPKAASAANGTGPPSKPVSSTPVKTPSKAITLNGVDTPSRRNLADKSARRKSARALLDRVMGDGDGEDEEDDDEAIAREIYATSGSEDGSENEEEDAEGDEVVTEATTPSKTPRGRPRKAAGKRSPTPPRDLPPHEQYFFQNKPGRAKTSNNDLSSLDLLTHDEYFTLLRTQKKPHEEDIEFLQTLHADSFPQWAFELSQGFSICLYGYGSKRFLLHRFATHLHTNFPDPSLSKIIIINGYVRTTSVREIINTIGSAMDPSQKIASGNPVSSVRNLFSLLSSHETVVTVIVNSIDAPPLRKSGIQSILSRLAAHPQIRLVCSSDTPDFPLLWDSGLRSSFNFVFHNCTTFTPFTAEIDVVDEVHELLGRRARRAGGKEGVTFVLRSLPENAKNLFRLLVTEVLVAMDEEAGASAEGQGVEYRMLYNKAVEEFICSSEMAFRTLLKEYVPPVRFAVTPVKDNVPANYFISDSTTIK
jgi:origin recognition complex subunit 2